MKKFAYLLTTTLLITITSAHMFSSAFAYSDNREDGYFLNQEDLKAPLDIFKPQIQLNTQPLHPVTPQVQTKPDDLDPVYLEPPSNYRRNMNSQLNNTPKKIETYSVEEEQEKESALINFDEE